MIKDFAGSPDDHSQQYDAVQNHKEQCPETDCPGFESVIQHKIASTVIPWYELF